MKSKNTKDLKVHTKTPKTYRKARKIASGHSCPELSTISCSYLFSEVDSVLGSCIRLPYFYLICIYMFVNYM